MVTKISQIRKNGIIFLLSAVLWVCALPSASCQSAPVNGLQLTLSTQESESQVPAFRLQLRNVGPKDLILKLGIMLANGKVQYPDAVVLNAADAQGGRRRFDLIGPAGIGGRADPFILPLPVEATFSIPVHLGKYWAASSKEWDYKFGPGKYWISAEFLGQAVREQAANLDSKYVALFPYWEGTVQSNELHFQVPQK